MAKRFQKNPLITTHDIEPSQPGWVVECVLNPGVFRFEEKTWLLLRVAERPVQKEGMISFPILYADGSLEILEFEKNDPQLDLSDPRIVGYKGKNYLYTLSHLCLVCSEDGVHFQEPVDFPTRIFGQGALETFGIEDSRVNFLARYVSDYVALRYALLVIAVVHFMGWFMMRSILREKEMQEV